MGSSWRTSGPASSLIAGAKIDLARRVGRAHIRSMSHKTCVSHLITLGYSDTEARNAAAGLDWDDRETLVNLEWSRSSGAEVLSPDA